MLRNPQYGKLFWEVVLGSHVLFEQVGAIVAGGGILLRPLTRWHTKVPLECFGECFGMRVAHRFAHFD